MGHQGEILKEMAEKSGMSIVDIARKSGVSRAQLYILFKETVIDQEYLDKLSKVGISLTSTPHSQEDNKEEFLELKIKHLEEIITRLEADNKFLRNLVSPVTQIKKIKSTKL